MKFVYLIHPQIVCKYLVVMSQRVYENVTVMRTQILWIIRYTDFVRLYLYYCGICI